MIQLIACDIDGTLLREAEALGVTLAVGLWQELQ